MTAAPNGFTLAPLSREKAAAVRVVGEGADLTVAARATGLTVQKVEAAIERDKLIRLNEFPAGRSPLPPRIVVSPPAAAPRRPTLTELLAWADQNGTPQARALATRIRDSHAKLRDLHDQSFATEAAAAEVQRLTRELAEARQRLREAGGKPTATPSQPDRPARRKAGAAPDTNRKAYLAAARSWLRAQGHELSDLGRIPAPLEALYAAAHPSTTVP